MTLTMRPYSDADLPVLQDTFARWIAEAGRCGYDHVGELPHRIYENLRGRRPVGSLVHLWEDASRIVGLAVNLRFGSAFDVFAAPSLRGSPPSCGCCAPPTRARPRRWTPPSRTC
ncbi:hypothetical protein [Nonomuraea recticatena]|uniref:hypothetical protein n=1 Tax=Nonomuraea recticatena TaxID=46178 RepID=UPI003620F27E